MAHFRETLSGAVWLSDLRLIVEIAGNSQRVKYYSSKEFGRILIIDDELQHVETWAPFYHEIIVHLPSSFIKRLTRALIIGGGSLFAAEELLKYKTVDTVDLVDHDMNVIKATTRAYPERAYIMNDRRLQIFEQTYQHYLPSCSNKYDLIINDCFDLYSIDTESQYDYYKGIANLLNDNGICSDLVYRSIYSNEIAFNALRRIPKDLRKAVSLLAVPEYPGIFHLLTMWGKNKSLFRQQNKTINRHQPTMHGAGRFMIYNPNFLQFYLYNPPYLTKYI